MKSNPINLQVRGCPGCGTALNLSTQKPWIAARLPETGWTSISFSSRKPRESFHWGYFRCASCELIFTPTIPGSEELRTKYQQADFVSSTGHRDAARDYAEFLVKLNHCEAPSRVLDVGAGDGSFLQELLRMGSREIYGIEGSESAVLAADLEIQGHLERIFVDPGSSEFQQWVENRREQFSYLTCFQTLEHLTDPLQFLVSIRPLLQAEGRIVIVCHDVEGWVQSLLGSNSPLLDLEHFQLFSRQTIVQLLERCGFQAVDVRPFSNRHSVSHWISLSPFSLKIRNHILRLAHGVGLSERRIRVPATNLVVVGQK